MPKTIAINAGSSSLKWKLYKMPQEKEVASGSIERIGLKDSVFKLTGGQYSDFKEVMQIHTHEEAVQKLLEELNKNEGRTIVMVIHELNNAARFADHMIGIKKD